MGGLKLTFKLGPKKPAADAGAGGSGGSAPSSAPRSLPSGPGGNAPHPFASGARTGGAPAGSGPDGGRPKIPVALLKAKLERERTATEAALASAGGVPSGTNTMKGVPKALLMKGVPKALQKASASLPGVRSGKVEKKKVKRPILAGAQAVLGLPGVKIRLVSKPASGIGAASATAAAAAMDSGYDSWGEDAEGQPATSQPSLVMQMKRKIDPPHDPVPVFTEPAPKANALNDVLKKLQQKDKHGIFAEPVTEHIAPGYFSVVREPMDFRTLKENVRLGKYVDWDTFATDVELIYTNAMAYNPLGTVVHSLAVKTLELARRFLEKQRSAGLSPAARAKRLKIAQVASMASFGGGDTVYTDDPSNPSMSRGVGAPSASFGGTGTGLEDDNSDDDEEIETENDFGKKGNGRKEGIRFKRHTFNPLLRRGALPSLGAWRKAQRIVAVGSSMSLTTSPETPQAMVRASSVFFQKRNACETYVASLENWSGALTGRARVIAMRLASAAKKSIPPAPPKTASPTKENTPDATEDNDAEDDEPIAHVFAGDAIVEDGSESDDEVALISIANRVNNSLPNASPWNPQKALQLAQAAGVESQHASACVKTAGLIARGAVEVGTRGDPLVGVRSNLSSESSDSFVSIIKGIHSDWSVGLTVVRDRIRTMGIGGPSIVPGPPPLPETKR